MDPTPTSEHRLESRNNIFVTATLYAADGSAPVRIRNMSPGGALIEGAVLPSIGSEVRLCRGSLTVIGRVVWREERRAGLRFTACVAVADWLPNAKSASAQQLADEMAHQARLGATSASATLVSHAPTLSDSALYDELMRLCRSLERAGEDLVVDAEIAARHSGPLQVIDMAAQSLAKLAQAHGDAAASPVRKPAAP